MIRFLALILLILPLARPAHAAQEHAAVLTVISGDVSLRRANTERWISLRAGASGPVGSGDAIRTNATGRAFVTFDEAARVLVMPTTEYRIEGIVRSDDGALTIEAEVEGLSIHYVMQGEVVTGYRLTAGHAEIVRPGELFAVWSDPGAPFAVTSAQGEVLLIRADVETTVGAGMGINAGLTTAVAFGPPYNEAMLRGATEGCEGTVKAADGVDLVVRDGSHFDALLMGSYETGEPVQVFGISEGGDRLRVHFLSGFGWVLALGVDQRCEDLPSFPVPFAESNRSVLNVTDAEFEILEPFYGRKVYDPFFYRFTR